MVPPQSGDANDFSKMTPEMISKMAESMGGKIPEGITPEMISKMAESMSKSKPKIDEVD